MPTWFVELVAVALGVYLALWAQRQADRRRDRRLESELSGDLLSDLQVDLVEIEAMGARVEDYEIAVRTLIAHLEEGASSEADQSELRRSIGLARGMERFRPATTTVDEVTASGAARVFRDRGKLRAVLDYHRRVEAHALTYHFFWRKMADHLWPALRAATPPGLLQELTSRLFYDADASDIPGPAVTLEPNADLVSALYDQLEVHQIAKGELRVYRELCESAITVVAGERAVAAS